jgi:hypothetical protein
MNHNRTVNVDRLELLSALQKNREAHQKEFIEVLSDYKLKLQHDLKQLAKTINKAESLSDFQAITLWLTPAPSYHDQEYAEIIEMLEMSIDPTIELNSQEFKAYFKNEWQWRQAFTAMASSYKV